VATVAARLGTPLKPFQRYVNDVALELDPDTNTLVYSLVVLLLPRQSGKTVITLPRLVTKGRMWNDLFFCYTAQDRNYALKKFEEDFTRRLEASRTFTAGRDYRARLGNGKERILFPKTRSQITIAATQATSGHGGTNDDVTVDEAFSHEDTTVDEGFVPTQITRGKAARDSLGKLSPGPQTWIISAAGDEDSHYFYDKVELGRAAVERGDDRGICYIEWSCPDDWDIFDRGLWWYYIPGLGHLCDEQDIAADQTKMGEAEWRRAYASQRKMVGREPAPIDPEDWGRQVDRAAQHDGRLVYGVDVSPDRSRASVGVAGTRAGGGYLVEMIESRPGTRWVPEFLAEVVERNGGAGVAVDRGSPAGSLIPDLEALGLEVIELNAGELDDAVAGAKKRTLGEAWAWDRKRPEVDITPLVSVTLAFGALIALPAEEESPDPMSQIF
jgi:phage terminase large subunit-like protein